MKKLMGAAMLAGATITGAGAANAEVSGSVSFTTDYVFRGISQTDNGPAIQGSFDYTQDIFYAGMWGSNVNFGGDESMELDLYVGVTPTTGPINWDLSLVGYFYPAADDDGAEFDYYEGIVGASTDITEQFSVGGQIAYSPEYFGDNGNALYYEINGTLALNDAASISGAWGNQDVDLQGDYDTWNIGGSLAMHGFTFDLRYHDTDISGLDEIVNLSISRAL
jgi:uncharacterized protein (TIGR02001 family)